MGEGAEPVVEAAQNPPAVVDEASAPFVGRWSHLVSRTNWEKGRIIFEWREALRQSGAPVSAFSDEAWARRVGGISAQHVGRLRRVFHRFGDRYEQFPGLYWSHFNAALEWDDAEMWLEGAVQNGWSVAAMRRMRAQTLGRAEEPPVATGEVIEIDGRFVGALEEVPLLPDPARRGAGRGSGTRPRRSPAEAADGAGAAPDAGGRPGAEGQSPEEVPFEAPESAESETGDGQPAFAGLPEDLPEDILEVGDLFKLAVLRHKQQGWVEVEPAQIVALLEALRQWVQSPVGA